MTPRTEVTWRTEPAASSPAVPYSTTLLDLVKEYWELANRHGADGDWARFGVEMLNLDRAAEALDLVAERVPFPLAGRGLLEIGAGVGAVQLVARRRGICAFGVEPGFLGARASGRLFAEQGAGATSVACAVGELLPFCDETFDVVCSFQVLEHVRDPAAVLAETRRVLKPGGYFVHVFPNFGSLWEGHYGVPWLPHLPKPVARLYLRLLGHDLSMLEELQLLSRQRVAALLSRHQDVKVIDWGTALWEHRVRTLEFSEWAYLGRVKRALRLLHRLRLIGPGIALGRVLRLETPIVLVGTRLGAHRAARPAREP